jgi:TPR repeat protein
VFLSPLDVLLSGFLAGGQPREEVRKDAEKGDAQQQTILAFGYGWGLSNVEESARWYRKAADQNYAPAQFHLGWMYDNTYYVGVPGALGQDYVEAARWYRKAADQGYAPAQFNLGVMFDSGEGVVQDYSEAVKFYRRAADQGLDKAQFNLGLKYDKGQGVGQDYVEAARWYRKAADQGLSRAQFNLGLKYTRGQGVSQDYAQAYMWINIAAPHANDADGKRYAAIRDRIAEKMKPTQIAEAQRLAATWYRKAADQGSFIAQSKLGLVYESGEGVAQDYVQAHIWMSLAASQASHSPNYAEMRDRVAAKMNPAQLAEAQRLAREWRPTEEKTERNARPSPNRTSPRE